MGRGLWRAVRGLIDAGLGRVCGGGNVATVSRAARMPLARVKNRPCLDGADKESGVRALPFEFGKEARRLRHGEPRGKDAVGTCEVRRNVAPPRAENRP